MPRKPSESRRLPRLTPGLPAALLADRPGLRHLRRLANWKDPDPVNDDGSQQQCWSRQTEVEL